MDSEIAFIVSASRLDNKIAQENLTAHAARSFIVDRDRDAVG